MLREKEKYIITSGIMNKLENKKFIFMSIVE